MADSTRVSIYSTSPTGSIITNSYKDLNPALTETNIRSFVDSTSVFVNGTLTKFVRTDSTTYYPAGNDPE